MIEQARFQECDVYLTCAALKEIDGDVQDNLIPNLARRDYQRDTRSRLCDDKVREVCKPRECGEPPLFLPSFMQRAICRALVTISDEAPGNCDTSPGARQGCRNLDEEWLM